jgi:NADP-dependent 3-hydroxy acid dehydrogenase YdfG
MDKRVVVITGASSGIGAALARLLGTAGHKVVLAARREQLLGDITREIGDNALAVKTDVTRREDVDHLKQVALEKCGRIDVWINNAGRGITRPVLALTDDDVEEMMNVNMKSALYGMQTIVPYFQDRNSGHLINVSSFLGRVPLVSFRSIYSAAKAALNMLTACLRMDLREKFPDIHISLVMPGVVMTDFHKNALGGQPQQAPGARRSTMNAQTPEEVAEVIADLLEHPKSEVYTNPALPEIARRYRDDVDAFERAMTGGQ